MAVATGIPPSELWAQDARDLVTLVDVLKEQNRRG